MVDIMQHRTEQLELLAEIMIYLISLHALMPIAITAFGPCNFRAILLFRCFNHTLAIDTDLDLFFKTYDYERRN